MEKELEWWFQRSTFSQMMDVWGEFDRLMNSVNKENIMSYFDVLKSICSIVCQDPKNQPGLKKELEYALDELQHYIDGEIDYDIRPWWDQWCYEINYDLL